MFFLKRKINEMINLHVTAIPSQPHFSKLAHNNNLSGIRMNGILFATADTLKEYSLIPKIYTVPLWLDAKGRQLRIEQVIKHQANYELVLNHGISGLELPHPIIFKAGEDWATIIKIEDDGKRLHLAADGFPKYRVNSGDSIHLRNQNLIVNGLFTKNEKEKVEHAYKTGFRNFYLSYVECQNDVDQFRELVKDSNIILKIENKKGLAFVDKSFKKQDNTQLAVGRGDLYVEVDRPHHILKAQKLIISKDPNAIVGSRMLLSLFNNDVPSCSDICEIGFLKSLGFKNFLLCDDLCKKESSQQRAIDTFTAIKNEL
jgi:pyruvate kinase